MSPISKVFQIGDCELYKKMYLCTVFEKTVLLILKLFTISMKNVMILTLLLLSTVMSWAANASDYNIVTTQPEGELKTYDRGGNKYYVYNDYVRSGAQVGTIDIVFGADNKVWMKRPVSGLEFDSWVEGSLSADGSTITVDLGQVLAFDSEAKQAIKLGLVEYDDEYEEFVAKSGSQITYTVKDDIITLNGTGRYLCLGAVWYDSNEWVGFADYNSKYTPKISEELVALPQGVETQMYKFRGMDYMSSKEIGYNVEVAFDGQDMYMKGLFSDTPNAWVKGSFDGHTATFASSQFLGKVPQNTASYYFMAVNRMNTSEIQDFTLTYDESTSTFSNNSQFIVLSTAKTTVYLTQAISDISLVFSKTGAAYPVPYKETFGSANSFNEFTIINANGDNNTWTYNSMNERADYNWSMTTGGDDWLITPAIFLEAGKNYVFSLRARSFSASLPEKFEVKMGNSNSVEAMTVGLIDTTKVETGDLTTYSAQVSVEADGNYFFGVHAVSDADNMMLAVDDIAVDEESVLGINAQKNTVSAANQKIYTLDGRLRAADKALSKGMYVKNGKKVVVR